MSTRCQIAIYDGDISKKLEDINFITKKWQALIYRHSDGYPDSVVPDILPFIEAFKEKRNDTEYLAACLVAYLKNWHCGQSFYKNGDEQNIKINNFETDVLCHGISKVIHMDIDYYYVVDANNLYVFQCSFWEKPYTLTLLETHPVKIPILIEK